MSRTTSKSSSARRRATSRRAALIVALNPIVPSSARAASSARSSTSTVVRAMRIIVAHQSGPCPARVVRSARRARLALRPDFRRAGPVAALAGDRLPRLGPERDLDRETPLGQPAQVDRRAQALARNDPSIWTTTTSPGCSSASASVPRAAECPRSCASGRRLGPERRQLGSRRGHVATDGTASPTPRAGGARGSARSRLGRRGLLWWRSPRGARDEPSPRRMRPAGQCCAGT